MNYDVVIVGAGPSGLACAIRLKQTAAERGQDLSVCVLEKASEVGAHVLSGAVMDPRALTELLPDWSKRGAPLHVPVTSDQFVFLTRTRAWSVPIPEAMQNHGNFIVSLSQVCRWLAREAEALGVEIYPGFAASEILYDDKGAVVGVATGDMGLLRDGQPGPHFQRGMALLARQTVFAEGCRGSLTRVLMEKFSLDQYGEPQTYGLGLKEIWETDASCHQKGQVTHSVGWPLTRDTYGGGWIYHLDNNQISVGFVVGLDYSNPSLSPFEEFQRFKTHPALRHIFENGRRIAYGAKALSEGGWQSIPRLTFPGGILVGDAAGFMNVPRIKGSHTALKSGMVAAEALGDFLLSPDIGEKECTQYATALKNSWVWSELYRVRNVRPGFHHGFWPGMLNAAYELWVAKGRSPWTLSHRKDHEQLKSYDQCHAIQYEKPDGRVTFDRPSSLFLANIGHDESQPSHLKLTDPQSAIEINYKRFHSPETHYCPAGVYEIARKPDGHPELIINAQNCLHCKTCDIKDPEQNIRWTTPEGGSGPNYANL